MHAREKESLPWVVKGLSAVAAFACGFVLFSSQISYFENQPQAKFWWNSSNWQIDEQTLPEKAAVVLPTPVINEKIRSVKKAGLYKKRITKHKVNHKQEKQMVASQAAPMRSIQVEPQPVQAVSTETSAEDLKNVWQRLCQNFEYSLRPLEQKTMLAVNTHGEQTPMSTQAVREVAVPAKLAIPHVDLFISGKIPYGTAPVVAQAKIRVKPLHRVAALKRTVQPATPAATFARPTGKAKESIDQIRSVAAQAEGSRDQMNTQEQQKNSAQFESTQNLSIHTNESPTTLAHESKLEANVGMIVGAWKAGKKAEAQTSQGYWSIETSPGSHGPKNPDGYSRQAPAALVKEDTQKPEPSPSPSPSRSTAPPPSPPNEYPRFIEAFNESKDLTVDIQIKSITQPLKNGKGWKLAQGNSYWDTLFLNDSDLIIHSIPMLSHNDVVMLAQTSQKQTGVVVGRVSAGYGVSFSGRSEPAVYFALNEKGDAVRTDTLEKDRFFILINASPGSQMIYLMSKTGETKAVVAMPVYAEMATYLDLTSPQKALLSGNIWDAGAVEKTAVPNVNLQLAGMSEPSATTNQHGHFVFSEAPYVRGYPIYLEAEMASGFKHRYEVDPRETQPRELFYFSSGEVNSWLKQLEGGVSPESGLVFAAFPKTIEKMDARESLVPELSTVTSNTLTPEAYTWDSNQKLLNKVEISSNNLRMMVVQISDGAHLLKLKHSVRKDEVWSGFTFVSAGVINVILE